MRRLAVALLLGLALLPGCRGSRTLALPDGTVELHDLATGSPDAAALRRQLARAGYSRISLAGMPIAGGTWNPMSSEVLIQLWRYYTVPAEGSVLEVRILRRAGRQRLLNLLEPPPLAALTREGDALVRRGDIRGAVAAYNRARRQAPGLPLLPIRISSCQLRMGDRKAAWQSLETALGLAGPHPEVYFLMGEYCEKTGRAGAAEDNFEKSAGLDPDNPERYARLARCYLAHGKAEKARQAAARALKLAPDDPAARELAEKLGAGR